MRIPFAVAVLAVLPCVAAFAARGAAERAMIYSLYAMEDIYGDDESKWTIAKGCTGTRDNLLKSSIKAGAPSKKRCTLAELLNHMWHETEGQALVEHKQPWRPESDPGQDKKPYEKATDEAPDEAARKKVDKVMNVINTGEGGVERLTKTINAVKDNGSFIRDVPVKNPDGTTTMKPMYRPKKNYTGFLNVGNVISGATDYYATIGALGDRFKAAQSELRALELKDLANPLAPSKDRYLPNGVKNNMNRWEEKFRATVEYVYELRIEDKAGYMVSERGLRYFYNRDTGNAGPDDNTPGKDTIKTKPHVFPNSQTSGYVDIRAYQEPDRAATIANWQADGFASETAAATKYDAAVDSYNASKSAIEHNAAIAAIRRTQSVATPSSVVTPTC
ncbi:hypothetical protein Micbo1qcDRAFT_180638 [Microdochium bolleyi]|uniref:Uncharacterized protein n=1 Tax=Microdochium bolleyi TaxID=196109 RepID=A0A136ILK2_9PEZI|nr:hypothetical protein Micbo1qcDRAFT_180638 [Microdochium bolleyi]